MIYAFIHPHTCEIRYVGKTQQPVKRLKHHRYLAKEMNLPLYRWWRGLLANGSGAPCFVRLSDGDSAEERAWIARLREAGARLLNMTDGGETGSSWRPDVAAKISASQLRRYKEHPEIRERLSEAISAATKGRPRSDRFRAARASFMRGAGNPAKRPEVAAKIAAAKTGDLNPAKRPDVKAKISAARRRAA